MLQSLVGLLKIGPMQAKELLNKLSEVGYLEYENATESKVASYQLTDSGFTIIRKASNPKSLDY